MRRELARYGAPAAFLAAATIAVLLIKAGLSGGSETSPPTVGFLPTTTTTTTQATTKLVLTQPPPTTSPAEGEYHVVESGDTLGDIALRYDTTVEELMRLNPEVDPTALRPGERIRVS